MNIKIVSTVVALSFLLIGSGCTPSPEQKIKDLQDAKANLMESSGYNACMKTVDDNLAKQKECTVAKLVAKGYTDNIDCFPDYQNPICQDTTRYNAQVNANNDCIKELDDPNALTGIDCMKLLSE